MEGNNGKEVVMSTTDGQNPGPSHYNQDNIQPIKNSPHGSARIATNTLLLEATEERREIINSLDQLNKTQESSFAVKEAILTRSNNQAERKIWFNVKRPVQQFKGRYDELNELHNILKQNAITLIIGSGGTGKTELTRKYCYEYREFYNDNIIWIDSESEKCIKESFIGLCKELEINIQKDEQDDIKHIIKKVYNFLGNRKCLIIFDNAEKDSIVNLLLPLHSEYPKPHILITSRVKQWEDGIKVMYLEVLNVEDALEVVKDGLGIKNESYKDLVNKLDRFPLSIQHAVAYIKLQKQTRKFTISDYLKLYKNEASNRKMDIGSTFTTLKITMEKIGKETNGTLALDILNIIAYMSPDKISNDIFFSLSTKREAISAISLLIKYSLLNDENDQSLFSIHRFIQLVLRLDLQMQKKEVQVLENALNLMNSISKKFWVDINRHVITIWNYACRHKEIVSKFYNSVYDDYSLIYILVQHGSLEAVKVLLEYMKGDLDFNIPLLHVAVLNGHLDIVKILLMKGFVIDAETLFLACGNGHFEIVKFFIGEGTDINTRYNSKTLFFVACQNGYLKIVEYLIQKGVDINDYCDNYTPLFVACQNGHFEIVKCLVGKEAEVNAECDGESPLFIACGNGYFDIVKYLVERNAKINIYCNGNTPLYTACSMGHFEIVKYLLEKRAKVNTYSNGFTPLYVACQNGHIEIVKYLLEKGAKVNTYKNGFTPLCVACQNGHFEIVKVLLGKRAKINIYCNTLFVVCLLGNLEILRYILEERNVINNEVILKSLLFKACHIGHFAIVKYILEKVINVNTYFNGYTPLYVACRHGHILIVEYLIKIGATINVNCNNFSPLYVASEHNYFTIVKYLIDNGANVNTDCYGCSPLLAACENGNFEIVRYLIEKGAEININNNGYTPLFVSCRRGHFYIVKHLIQKGADAKSIDKNGSTLLHFACIYGNMKFVAYLLNDIKIDINICNEQGISPLHYAVFSQRIPVIQYLLNKNADINIFDKQGATPLYYAALSGDWNIVKFFIKKNASVTFTNNTLIGKNYFTVLHIATAYDAEEIVRILVERGVDKDVGKDAGLTPLDIAKLFECYYVTKYLSDIGATFSTSSEIISNLNKYIADTKMETESESESETKDENEREIKGESDGDSETEDETEIEIELYSEPEPESESHIPVSENNKHYKIASFTNLLIFIYTFIDNRTKIRNPVDYFC